MRDLAAVLPRRSLFGLIAVGMGPRCRAAAAQETMQVAVTGGNLDVSLAPGPADWKREHMLSWIQRSGSAIETYYGAFPVDRLTLRVQPVAGESGVFRGVTFGSDPPLIRISIGEHATTQEIEDDWVLTHEFVHLAFPSVPRRNHWIEEGLATYVEPLARLQARQITPARYWSELVQGLPKGQPESGDRGLDHTHTWGRTYWGGALFCFVADVRIRQKTDNRLGLQHALRGIVKAGGTIKTEWSLQRALETGDAAVACAILNKMYMQWKDRPRTVPLKDLWQQLGVAARYSSVVFDDGAPLAEVRQAMMLAIS